VRVFKGATFLPVDILGASKRKQVLRPSASLRAQGDNYSGMTAISQGMMTIFQGFRSVELRAWGGVRLRCGWVCIALFTLMSGYVPGGVAQAVKTQANVVAQVRVANGETSAQETEFVRAQAAAREVLARAEFQSPQLTWWDRLKTKMFGWLSQLFMSIDRVTSNSPWLGRLLEWLLFLGAAVALLVWLLRMVRRQRMRVALGGAAQASTEWARESEDWQRLAEEHAARGAWREAIHALYWAAIVLLERKRAWRHNPARTPREYVRLLRAGSLEQRELRGLTSALERTWYGQRPAQAEEYGEAQQSLDRLASGREAAEGGRA